MKVNEIECFSCVASLWGRSIVFRQCFGVTGAGGGWASATRAARPGAGRREPGCPPPGAAARRRRPSPANHVHHTDEFRGLPFRDSFTFAFRFIVARAIKMLTLGVFSLVAVPALAPTELVAGTILIMVFIRRKVSDVFGHLIHDCSRAPLSLSSPLLASISRICHFTLNTYLRPTDTLGILLKPSHCLKKIVNQVNNVNQRPRRALPRRRATPLLRVQLITRGVATVTDWVAVAGSRGRSRLNISITSPVKLQL